VIATVLAVALAAQAPDTLLVSVELVGVGSATVAARLDADSTLELPSSAVHELLGVVLPMAWVPVPTLARAYPAVTFAWIRRRLALIITDPRRVLRGATLAFPHRACSAVSPRTTQGARCWTWGGLGKVASPSPAITCPRRAGTMGGPRRGGAHREHRRGRALQPELWFDGVHPHRRRHVRCRAGRGAGERGAGHHGPVGSAPAGTYTAQIVLTLFQN